MNRPESVSGKSLQGPDEDVRAQRKLLEWNHTVGGVDVSAQSLAPRGCHLCTFKHLVGQQGQKSMRDLPGRGAQ